MWLWLSLASAVMLGFYDVVKKQSMSRNSALWVLLVATALSTLFLCPFLSRGPLSDHLALMLKAVLVSLSWVSGMYGLKLLPLTTVSTIKGSRPLFVVLFSVLLFGERLNLWQWVGVALVLLALFLLNLVSLREGIDWRRNKGIACMAVSVLAGVASALYDKKIIANMEPLFVQSWANFYITVLIGLTVLVKALRDGDARDRFHWDWRILLIAVLITASDCCYFFSLKDSAALLSVVSMIRRGSVVVTFVLGAVLFKEKQVRSKAIDMAILLCGIALLMFASSQ